MKTHIALTVLGIFLGLAAWIECTLFVCCGDHLAWWAAVALLAAIWFTMQMSRHVDRIFHGDLARKQRETVMRQIPWPRGPKDDANYVLRYRH